jgi:hypothetical protein
LRILKGKEKGKESRNEERQKKGKKYIFHKYAAASPTADASVSKIKKMLHLLEGNVPASFFFFAM